MPRPAPITRKRGRPLKLGAAVYLSAPALDENLVNLANAPDVHYSGGPVPARRLFPLFAITGKAETPKVTGRPISKAIDKDVALPAPKSVNARRVSTRTTNIQPLIRFGQSKYVAFEIAIEFLLSVNNAWVLVYLHTDIFHLRSSMVRLCMQQ